MIRVLLADDEHLIRVALAQMLDLEDDIEIVGQASTGPEAVAQARHSDPTSPCSTSRCPSSTASPWPPASPRNSPAAPA